MALYESLDRQDRTAPMAYSGSYNAQGLSSAGTSEPLVGAVRVVLLGFLLLCWIAGAYAGIVYWSFHSSLLGVIASAVIPGLAATATWSAFMELERLPRR